MFCPKCGTENEDGAAFCASCGEALEAASVETAATESQPAGEDTATAAQSSAGEFNASYAAETEDNTSGNKNFKPVIAVVAVVVVVFILGKLLFGSSYKDPIDGLVKNLNKQETKLEKYTTAFLPKFAQDAYDDVMAVAKKTDEGEDMMDELDDMLEDQLFSSIEDQYGDYKISYEIKDKEKLDKDELEDIADAYDDLRDYLDDYDDDAIEDAADEMDLSKSDTKKLQKAVSSLDDGLKNIKVSKGYAVEIKVKIKGDDDSDTETLEFNVVKVNGKWIIDITSSGILSYLYYYM